MDKKFEMSKDRQNALALQLAIKERGIISYDPKAPLIINSETKILRIYNKDLEEILQLDDEEDEKENEMFDLEEDEERFSLDEMINREFNYYDNSLEEVEETSFDEHKYREVRIVFADKTSNPQASKKVKYSKDIFTDLSLEEIQEKLLECNNEDDIEEIQE